MRVAADIEEIIHVPEDEDPQAVKEIVLANHVGDELPRRDRFIEALGAWLREATA